MKNLLFAMCLLLGACSSVSEEDEIYNLLLMNESDCGISINEIESTSKTRYCYPFAVMQLFKEMNYLTLDENKMKVYERFKEDSIAGYPGSDLGLPSKVVKYTLSNGEKKHTVVYFGKGGKAVTATLSLYKLCH